MVAHSSRMMTAALISVLIAAVMTGLVYTLVVVTSFFVPMPTAARNELVVGGLLTVIFTGTFVFAFRNLVTKIER